MDIKHNCFKHTLIAVTVLATVLTGITVALITTEAQAHQQRQFNKKLTCLAEVIWREARGESYWGKVAVAQVVMNRTRDPRFPQDICKVIFQKNQFQWTKTWGGHWKADHDSYHIAHTVLTHKHPLHEFKALYFHANYVNPRWQYKKLAKIGKHIFYV